MKTSLKVFYISLSFILFFIIEGFGQTTKVRGTVIDAVTKEPIPFVNIRLFRTDAGNITDFNGGYYIETREKGDTLIFSFVGYETQKIKINPRTFQNVDVELQPSDITLQEIIVTPGENPAFRILRNIEANRQKNSPTRFDAYECEVYNKMEIDVNNVDEKFKKQKVFKHFQFIFDYVDTSAITGKPFLPVFISENISDLYRQNDPKKIKEVIKASNVSGVSNESILEYTGQMYLEVDIYNNFIPIFQKSFVSPIANFGRMYYKYYLTDSAYIDGNYCYHISFKPKRRQEPTFTGDFWVHDSTWAIKKVTARIADDANLNFVNDLVATQEYQRLNDSTWFIEKDILFVDFNLKDSTTGFFGRKTTSYKNITVNKRRPETFFDPNAWQQTVTLDGAMKKDTSFWSTARHEKLSKKEEDIYSMVDSIKEVPVFRTFVDLVKLFISGYYVVGNFEFGPYYTFYSFNEIEGNRFRLGGRTSNDFSTKYMLTGRLAYGTKDQKFKYSLGGVYMINKRPRESVGLTYTNDMEQLGQTDNAFLMDNILASILQRKPINKLTLVKQYDAFYEKEWFEGFSNKISFQHRTLFSTVYIPFQDVGTDNFHKNIITAEIRLNTRLAYNEKFVYGEFERMSLGTEFPVFNLDLTGGLKNIFNSDFDYFKSRITVQYDFKINPFGKSYAILEAGKIWGKVPYPLLKLHEGNETYAFDDYAYNMMNYYEFASDQYASLYYEHHFEGFFLNRIPLLRRLKWREIVYGKGLIGSIDDRNRTVMIFPEGLQDLSKKPYYEAGIGIENIFKIIRIDAVWRLSYLDKPNIELFGLRAKLQIIF